MRNSALRIKESTPAAGKFPFLVRNGESVPEGTVTIATHTNELLELERLISVSLASIYRVSADRFEGEIAALLRQILDSCRFDRCALMALTPDKSGARALYVSHGETVAAIPDSFAFRDMLPWTGENLLKGNIVCFSSVTELPPRAADDRRHYEELGVTSSLAIPIYIGGAVEFFFLACHLRARRVWHKEIISMLRLVGEVIVNALSHCRDNREMNARQRFEDFVSDLSVKFINIPAGEIDREITAALEKVRELFRFDRTGLMAFSADKREVIITHISNVKGAAPVPSKTDVSVVFPWAKEKLLRGEIISFTSLDELPEEAAVDRRSWQAFGIKSHLSVPIHVGGSVEYFVAASHVNASHPIDKGLFSRLRLLGEIFANALVRCRVEAEQNESLAEIQRLKEKLQSEADYLESEISCRLSHEEIIGQSEALARSLVLTEQVAPTDSTVLICGETGTGKELIAREIHKLSQRRNKILVKVNCASLPAALVESELFGREKGAYTGALTRQAGRFELADGGTIFLDEIAEMSLELQAKLLRVLQEGEFERLGSTKTIRVDVRVIAATNRNLADEVRKGMFREDLFYRLNVFQIVVPPLRERVEDIPLLAWAFVNELGEKMGKKINRISKQEMLALQCHSWPGNVRELRNVIEHAIILSTSDKLQVRLPENGRHETPGILTLEEQEIRHIQEALRLTGWRIKGEGGAARLLGINPSTLYSRMQKLGIINRHLKDEMSP